MLKHFLICDSSVGIALGYGLDDRGPKGSISGGKTSELPPMLTTMTKWFWSTRNSLKLHTNTRFGPDPGYFN
jgi:hypothetical protein